MNINVLSKIFGKKTPNSTAIAAEIEKARTEHDNAIAKRGAALAGLGAMSDEEHAKAEAEHDVHRRAADRAAARIADLEKAHAEALATEAEAEKQAEAERFRKRVEAARTAVEVEGAELLAEYDRHAAAIADVLTRLDAINTEARAVNELGRYVSGFGSVRGIDDTYRKHPDRQASERREMHPVWRYAHGAVNRAKENADGTLHRPEPVWVHHLQRFEAPELGREEIVVERTMYRPGRYETPLSVIHLPAGFVNGNQHWPRE